MAYPKSTPVFEPKPVSDFVNIGSAQKGGMGGTHTYGRTTATPATPKAAPHIGADMPAAQRKRLSTPRQTPSGGPKKPTATAPKSTPWSYERQLERNMNRAQMAGNRSASLSKLGRVDKLAGKAAVPSLLGGVTAAQAGEFMANMLPMTDPATGETGYRDAWQKQNDTTWNAVKKVASDLGVVAGEIGSALGLMPKLPEDELQALYDKSYDVYGVNGPEEYAYAASGVLPHGYQMGNAAATHPQPAAPELGHSPDPPLTAPAAAPAPETKPSVPSSIQEKVNRVASPAPAVPALEQLQMPDAPDLQRMSIEEALGIATGGRIPTTMGGFMASNQMANALLAQDAASVQDEQQNWETMMRGMPGFQNANTAQSRLLEDIRSGKASEGYKEREISMKEQAMPSLLSGRSAEADLKTAQAQRARTQAENLQRMTEEGGPWAASGTESPEQRMQRETQIKRETGYARLLERAMQLPEEERAAALEMARAFKAGLLPYEIQAKIEAESGFFGIGGTDEQPAVWGFQ